MKSLFIMLVAVFSVTSSHAAPISAEAAEKARLEAQKNRDQINAQIAQLENNLKKADVALTDAQKKSQLAEDRYSTASTDHGVWGFVDDSMSRMAGGVVESLGGTYDRSKVEANTQRLQRDRDEAQAARDQAATALTLAEKAKGNIQRDLEAQRRQTATAEKNATDSARQADNYNYSLDQVFKMYGINQQMDGIRGKSAQVGDNINALNRIYDNAVMGFYMKSKLEAMVNSTAFCEASKRCGTGKPAGYKADDIFKGSPSTYNRGKPAGAAAKPADNIR